MYPISYLAGLLAAAASVVWLAPARGAGQTGADGVMSFPNVNVVAHAASAPPASRPAGFMAYKDPATGRLSNPTAEQSAALTGAAPPVAPIARPMPTTPLVARPAHGGLSVMLDERHDRYAIARKAADGSVSTSCEPAGARP